MNAVPRASKKEEEVIAFMKKFGASLSLEVTQDAIGNVLITKPATAGMENRKTIVMQSHLDMVHQKNNATDFDFASQGIQMKIEGDWVKANGTTLGADNGIGVATIMAILSGADTQFLQLLGIQIGEFKKFMSLPIKPKNSKTPLTRLKKILEKNYPRCKRLTARVLTIYATLMRKPFTKAL